MTAYKGSLALIKVGDGGAPENFTTLGGLQVLRFSLRNQALDASHIGSGSWRNLLDGAGMQAITLTGAGLFTDAASEELFRGYAFAQATRNYEFHFANGDVVRGAFLITRYERLAPHDGEERCEATLESAGELEFFAA